MSTSNSSHATNSVSLTEEEFWKSARNPKSLIRRQVRLIGKITLLQLTPFKLSSDQTSSYVNYLRMPWPKQDQQIDRDVILLVSLQEFITTCQPGTMTPATACGLVTVMATVSAGVQYISEAHISGDFNLMESEECLWDYDLQPPVTKDTFHRAFNDEMEKWFDSIAKRLTMAVYENPGEIPGDEFQKYCLTLESIFWASFENELERLMKAEHSKDFRRTAADSIAPGDGSWFPSALSTQPSVASLGSGTIQSTNASMGAKPSFWSGALSFVGLGVRTGQDPTNR